jgi:hypothetical protein
LKRIWDVLPEKPAELHQITQTNWLAQLFQTSNLLSSNARLLLLVFHIFHSFVLTKAKDFVFSSFRPLKNAIWIFQLFRTYIKNYIKIIF